MLIWFYLMAIGATRAVPYFRLHTEEVTWDHAKRICAKEGGILPELGEAVDKTVQLFAEKGSLWVGAERTAYSNNGHWHWNSGRNVSFIRRSLIKSSDPKVKIRGCLTLSGIHFKETYCEFAYKFFCQVPSETCVDSLKYSVTLKTGDSTTEKLKSLNTENMDRTHSPGNAVFDLTGVVGGVRTSCVFDTESKYLMGTQTFSDSCPWLGRLTSLRITMTNIDIWYLEAVTVTAPRRGPGAAETITKSVDAWLGAVDRTHAIWPVLGPWTSTVVVDLQQDRDTTDPKPLEIRHPTWNATSISVVGFLIVLIVVLIIIIVVLSLCWRREKSEFQTAPRPQSVPTPEAFAQRTYGMGDVAADSSYIPMGFCKRDSAIYEEPGPGSRRDRGADGYPVVDEDDYLKPVSVGNARP